MEQNQIKQTVSASRKPGCHLRVIGYRDSRGGVSDIDVLPLPEGGYHALLRESLKGLSGLDRTASADLAGIDDITWTTATGELRDSWRKSIAGLGGGRSRPTYPRGADGFFTKEGVEGSVVLADVRRRTVAQRVSPPRGNQSPVAAAKEIIKRHLPVGEYAAAVILAPGKFDDLMVVGDGA